MEENAVDSIIEGIADTAAEVDPEFLDDFIVETKEHIEKIEMDVLTLENESENMETIHSLFRSFHTIKGLAGFVEQDLIQKIAHQTETLLDSCRKGSVRVNKIIIDLILNSSDYIKKLCDNLKQKNEQPFLEIVDLHIKKLENRGEHIYPGAPADNDKNGSLGIRKIGEILIASGKARENEIDQMLEKQKTVYPQLKLGQIAVKEKKLEAKEVIESLRVQEDIKAASRSHSPDGGYMRIPTQKVDSLVDMMGELIITQSLIEQEASLRFNSNDSFISNLLRMSRITKDIQNLSMSLRMVSLKSTFQKISRIARDTVAELGKNVNVLISGEDTEIDRGVAEKLLDPLLHLVKNAISHGIEDEKSRAEKGKPAQGLLKVNAFSKRGNVYIEISDDGSGISYEKVYKKAVEKKLIDSSRDYSQEEIANFIFLPGFSTADKVDNVSGRGVGLDVVKTEISGIGGRVEVFSQPGSGSTFVLKIPMNMAVMNGTIVDITGTYYIIPTLQVKQIFKPEKSQWISVKGKKTMIRLRDSIIQVIPIRKIFGLKTAGPNMEEELIVVLELEQKLKALPVTGIIGKREIVVKPLGNEFKGLDFVSGASILGDGRVSLILDIETLFRMEGDE